jgi:hypothetical protein
MMLNDDDDVITSHVKTCVGEYREGKTFVGSEVLVF